MKKMLLLAVLLAGVFALGAPNAALADACHDYCGPCEAAPTGDTAGCLAPAGDDVVSICGDAGVPAGCVCVGGQCVNNVDVVDSQDPASIAGCPSSVRSHCN